jgi:hypothetical protein
MICRAMLTSTDALMLFVATAAPKGHLLYLTSLEAMPPLSKPPPHGTSATPGSRLKRRRGTGLRYLCWTGKGCQRLYPTVPTPPVFPMNLGMRNLWYGFLPTGSPSPAHQSPLTPMLDANSPAFRQQYPNGATVYDRTGRRICGVIACNPETGEVITHSVGWIARAWFNALWVQDPFSCTYLRRFDWLRIGPRLLGETVVDGEFLRRHGFWPAPLRIECNFFIFTVGDAHSFAEGQAISVGNVSYAVASVTHTAIAVPLSLLFIDL